MTKVSPHWSAWGLSLALLLGGVVVSSAITIGNVAPPNVLWHKKSTAQNRIWIMNGTNFSSEVNLPGTADEPAWKMIGTGDFNSDRQPDIVWQNEITGQVAVWFMNGTSLYSSAVLPSAGNLNWKLVGVGDFDGDGKPDLLWQNLVTVQNAIWLMNGVTPVSYNLIVSSGDPNWRIATAGDLNGDGKADIILRNQSTGQNAVWFMNGLQMVGSDLFWNPDGTQATISDQDWKIVGTGDYNGDGRADLLWRHSTLGLSVCWFLTGTTWTAWNYLSQPQYDTDWRISVQDTADSTWRLQTASYTWVRAAVTTSPPSVKLTFQVVANTGFGITVQRRLMSDTGWTTLASGLQSNSYTDTSVAAGRRYEYKVFREQFGGFVYGGAEHVCVAVGASAIEDRGKVILLVDRTLSSSLATSLVRLSQDLVGDGWGVLRYDVPRHIDDYSSSTSFLTNAYNITNVIKPLIRAACTKDPANIKAVFIIGHVAIPYSGSFNVDGHGCGAAPNGPDHRGAWPADMYYGDLEGNWTDSTVNYINCNFAEANNIPNDGKFDPDTIPSPLRLKLAVGRVDFARLPVLTSTPPPGITPRSEVTLLQQYLTKDHLYRLRRLSWQSVNPTPRAMVYGHFHDTRDNPIFENAAQSIYAINGDLTQLAVGDFCLQRGKPSYWAFLSGPGATDRLNTGIPVLEHTAADLADPAKEPQSAFYMVLASYLGDWNLSNNNYLRSLLSTPNFGLASMWTRFSTWRIDAMGVGDVLGAAQSRMVNDPKNGYYDISRDLAILGDPTLRLHVLTPPSNLTATSSSGAVQLSWSPSEAGAQYYVYRGNSTLGPFTRISAAISGTNFTDTAPSSIQKTYMVRAIKPTTVANGSYTNISQGAMATSF